MRRSSCILLVHVAAWDLLAGCSTTRKDEALAILEVTASEDVPAFTTIRFSVPARPTVPIHEVPPAAERRLRFGYYLPGPNGPALVRAEALSAASCVVGAGTAEVDVQLGKVLAPVSLTIAAASPAGETCLAPADASADVVSMDAPVPDALADDAAADDVPRPDAPRADGPRPDGPRPDGPRPDARPVDARVPPSDAVPACLAATRLCPASAPCCPGLSCGTNSLGLVCCGNYLARCAEGTDCCGDFECVGGACCLPGARVCQTGGCCAGLVCGTNDRGRVCCGNAGAPCKTADGSDCCGALGCVLGRCTAPL